MQYLDNTISVERVVFVAVPNPLRTIGEDYMRMIRAPKSVKKRFEGILEHYMDHRIDDMDIAKAYGAVQVGKLLLLHDKTDTVTRLSAAERILEHWDNAQLMVTEGYGHFSLVKNTGVIARVAAFMNE